MYSINCTHIWIFEVFVVVVNSRHWDDDLVPLGYRNVAIWDLPVSRTFPGFLKKKLCTVLFT